MVRKTPRTCVRVPRKDADRQSLIKRLDKLTSLYVRQNGADRQGFNVCYTCGARHHWKDLDCGHYIKRRYLHTRWDLSNVRPQCRNCNRTLGGNYKIYEPKIIKELGQDNVQKLWDKAYNTSKIPTTVLEGLAEDLKKKVDSMGKR